MNKETKTRPPREVPPEARTLGLQFLEAYFEQAQAQIDVKLMPADERGRCVFRLEGELGILKRSPRQLEALERMTSVAMSVDSKYGYRCQLDLEGQLSAREALLKVIAADAAAVAEHTHKRAIIEGLSSFERRAIHQAVSEIEGMETLSEGDGEFRYLMVALKT